MSRVLAHGVDLVEVARIGRSIEEHGDHFINRCFTPKEIEYAKAARPPRDIERFAARFAAKEAVLKALGTGWSGGIAWTDVEVVKMASGDCGVSLSGKARQVADDLGISVFHLSMSHTGTNAMASVIACGA